jgi:hypothetical protein
MKFFKSIKMLREENREATKNSRALMEELDKTESVVDDQHKEALARLDESKKQARILKSADQKNHYSEGLTRSYQERMA